MDTRLDEFVAELLKITNELKENEANQDFEKCEYLHELMLRMISREAKMMAFGSEFTEQEWFARLLKTKNNLYNQ